VSEALVAETRQGGTAPTCRTCRHRAPGEPLRCAHPTEPVEARILQWQERTGWRAFWCDRHEKEK